MLDTEGVITEVVAVAVANVGLVLVLEDALTLILAQ